MVKFRKLQYVIIPLFFAIADLKNFSWCNAIQQIKMVSSKLSRRSNCPKRFHLWVSIRQVQRSQQARNCNFLEQWYPTLCNCSEQLKNARFQFYKIFYNFLNWLRKCLEFRCIITLFLCNLVQTSASIQNGSKVILSIHIGSHHIL